MDQLLTKKASRLLSVILALLTLIALLAACQNNAKSGAPYTLEDLQNKKLGVTVGSVAEIVGREKYPNAEIIYFNDLMDAVAALKAGQIDGCIATWAVAFLSAKTDPNLMFIDEPLTNDMAGIAVKKGNDELLEAVNNFLTIIKNNGTLDDMTTRWYDVESRDYVMPDIPEIKTGNSIKIGVAANLEPLQFIDSNGKFSGLDIELALRIGAELDRPVEFIDMKYASLIPALESEQIDLIIAAMSVTEERQKSVNFTQTYTKTPQMMIVRKTN